MNLKKDCLTMDGEKAEVTRFILPATETLMALEKCLFSSRSTNSNNNRRGLWSGGHARPPWL
jgi:hypothetical protein